MRKQNNHKRRPLLNFDTWKSLSDEDKLVWDKISDKGKLSIIFSYKKFSNQRNVDNKSKDNTSPVDVHEQIVNESNDVDGLIVQLPLPNHIDENIITHAILHTKDVDGFHPINIGRMVLGLPCYIPATPFGILSLFNPNV